jgi:hypothetical protein
MLIFASMNHEFDLPLNVVRFSMVAGIVLIMLGIPGLAKTKQRRGFEVKLTSEKPVRPEKERDNDHG